MTIHRLTQLTAASLAFDWAIYLAVRAMWHVVKGLL
jgi:hypothetical protein